MNIYKLRVSTSATNVQKEWHVAADTAEQACVDAMRHSKASNSWYTPEILLCEKVLTVNVHYATKAKKRN